MDILSKNLYFSTDYTYNLKRLMKGESIVMPGDKDSAIVLMNKNDC